MEDNTNDQPSCEPKLREAAAIHCDGTCGKQSDYHKAFWEHLCSCGVDIFEPGTKLSDVVDFCIDRLDLEELQIEEIKSQLFS